MDYLEFDHEPPSNLATMVVGFGGWIDAGEAATRSIRHMVRQLSAPRLAAINPEEFFDFTQVRPTIRLATDGSRIIRWPRSEFYTWQPPDGSPGLLLFRGMEPNRMWRTYCKMFLDLAQRCGVQRIISIGALLAALPHTRPPRVTGHSSDPNWQSLLRDWGVFRRPTYEGPTGIASVLIDAATQRGMPYLSFMGQSPHYLQVTANPAVRKALLTYVSRLLDIDLELSQLDEAITSFCTQCDQAVGADSSTNAYVRQLEQEYDSAADEEPQGLPDEELNSEKLMQELEDFLREEREGGSQD